MNYKWSGCEFRHGLAAVQNSEQYITAVGKSDNKSLRDGKTVGLLDRKSHTKVHTIVEIGFGLGLGSCEYTYICLLGISRENKKLGEKQNTREINRSCTSVSEFVTTQDAPGHPQARLRGGREWALPRLCSRMSSRRVLASTNPVMSNATKTRAISSSSASCHPPGPSH